MNDKPNGRSQDIVVALVGVVGLFVAMLGFMLAYAAHFNNKLERCVTKDAYEHHNHGGKVPSEGP
jgi:hypothetical protein